MEAPSDRSRSSVGRFRRLTESTAVQVIGSFMRRYLWLWPAVFVGLTTGVGLWVYSAVEGAMRQQRADDLNTMVEASVTAVRVWTEEQVGDVRLMADDSRLLPAVNELLPLADGTPNAGRKLRDAKAQETLRGWLSAKVKLNGQAGYLILAPDGTVLAADMDAPIGMAIGGERMKLVQRAMAGEVALSKPFRSTILLPGPDGEPRAGEPTMYAIGPVRGGEKVVAALALRVRPEDRFTRILEVVRFGATGETIAFDRNGLLLSQSRFDDQMKQIGLLADLPDSKSILTLEVRDPGVNMVEGGRPKLRRAEQPLTMMATDAVEGRDGHDADGYRGYRGVTRVGAWRWLEAEDFGIATEVDAAEAYRPVYILRRAFGGLLALLGVATVGIFAAMVFIARQQRALQQATLANRQLGQYALEDKIASGGMGTVYRARHSLLRRPTAVKLLDPEQLTEAAAARFEREVQLTASLTHPNTVAVFDFGRTPEGIFYYAMEYLEGLTLEDLVKRHGPVPEARVVYLLRQACGSLAEAHAAGMVHRDVKPANIFLTTRGGVPDFVKVLDFGLVKAVGSEKAGLTNPNALMGTPYYMAPESVDRPDAVDARADVYAVAAVAYFLLTGTTVFTGETVMDVCLKQARDEPEPPSARRGRPVSADFEALILRCLAKSPDERPVDAGALLIDLEACDVEGAWTARDAAAWWASPTGPGPAATVVLPTEDTGNG